MAEIETFVFQGPQIRGQVREGIVIKIGALQALAVDIDQIELRIVDLLRGFFVICHEIGVTLARLGFHQFGDLVECRAGVNRGQRQAQRQQTVAMMVRVMATTTQHPGEGTKNSNQSKYNAQTGKYVLTNPCARQAIRQGVEYRIIDTVTGKVIAGV